MPADNRITVAAGLDVIPLSSDEVLVRFGTRSRPSEILRDADLRGVLTRLLLELVRAPHTLSDLLRDLDDGTARDARELLESLLDRGILTRADSSPVDQYLDYATGRHSQLELRSVSVIGVGPVGARIARSLIQHGVGALKLHDDRLPDPVWRSVVGVAHGEARVDALLAHSLREAADRTEVTASDAPLDGEGIQETVDATDMAVLALEHANPRVAHLVNRVALKLHRPWLLAMIDGSFGTVGPLVVPGRTACFNCYATLAAAATPFREIARKHDHYLRQDHGGDFFPGLPVYADIVAAHGSLATLNLLLDLPSFAVGRSLIIDFTEMIVDIEDVLRLPRCPVCASDRYEGVPPFSPEVATPGPLRLESLNAPA